MANTPESTPVGQEQNATPEEDQFSIDESNILINDRKPVRKNVDPVTFHSRSAEINLKNPNPILEAAKPLLRIITNVPEKIERDEVTDFRNVLENEIDIFSSICDHLSIKREHAITARYCLCTALDETINQTNWGGGDESGLGYWPTESLLSTFHKDSYGGDKLFLLTGKLSAHPSEHANVLELIYYLLELGFEGRYRHDPNGKRQLETIKSRLLNIINSERKRTEFTLAPNWQPSQIIKKKTGWRIPTWLILLLALLFLLGQYSWYKLSLDQKTATLNKQITSIGDIPFKPQKLAFEKPMLSTLLKPEIDSSILTLTGSESTDLISFRGDGMFASARAAVDPKLNPTFERIVVELNKIPNATILITGHSDNAPIKTAQFGNNNALSEARAKAVAGLFERYGYPKNLITAEGKGESAPVADNKTAEGRAKNRRVEILVQYNSQSSSDSTPIIQPLATLDQQVTTTSSEPQIPVPMVPLNN